MRRRRGRFSPLDSDCTLCDPGQLLQCQFDSHIQLKQLELGRLTAAYQVHGHGPGLFLVAFKRHGAEKHEVVDGMTTEHALDKALLLLRPPR